MIKAQIDANGNRTEFRYDELGFQIAATIMLLNQRSTMTYDEVDNLHSMTDFNGRSITYVYDEQNRLTEKQFQDGSKVQYGCTHNGLQDTVTFRNNAGLVSSFYDYDYDERDRLTKRTDVLGTGSDQTSRAIQYGYDRNSNQTSVTTASGITTYSYDERNRLDLVKLNGQLQADYDYDAVNRLTQTTFGNGTNEVRQYDTLNRLKELTSKRGAIELSKYVYTLDNVGNRKTAIESVNGQSRSINYTYDDLYRLTDEAISDAVNGDRTSHYVYDNIGNRQIKTVNGVSTLYSYDANDRLLNEKVGGAIVSEYTYDNNGSTKTKTKNGVVTSYSWNDEKRLVSATVGNGQAVQYSYNDYGIRVSSIVDGVATRYLLDEGGVANVWEEYSPNGSVQAAYVYGNDLIEQTKADFTSFYLVDGLGSTRLLTDSQGQVLNSYSYEAFGQTVSQSGSTSNQYQFAGEQLDTAIGDYYLRQRFYDSSSGRFGRMDTYEGKKQIPMTLNKYTYANSSPTYWVDPSGFTSFMPFPPESNQERMRRGAEINNIIGMHFISGDFENREYDHHYGDRGSIPAGASTITLRKIILRAALDYNEFGSKRRRGMPDTGLPSDNRKAPDLVDFGSYEVYEVKPSSSFDEGVKQVSGYLPILNAWEYPGNNFWKSGQSYAPPSMIVTSQAKVYTVNPPRQGVVTYTEQFDLKGLAAFAFYMMRQSIQAKTAELVSNIIMASHNAAYGAF